MCSLAPPAALGFDAATAFLDRRRGVAALVPATCGVMAREPVCRGGSMLTSTPTPQKRSRDGNVRDREGFAAGEEVSVTPAPGQQRLQARMRAELDAVCALHLKAVLLCRGASRSGACKDGSRFSAAGQRREAPLEEEAAKRRRTAPSPPKSATTVAAHQKQLVKKQQQPPVQRAAPPSATEVHRRRRMDEIARSREECRQQVLEVEMTALPDEAVSPHDLEELGIAPFEYAVTRTRSQARRGVPR